MFYLYDHRITAWGWLLNNVVVNAWLNKAIYHPVRQKYRILEVLTIQSLHDPRFNPVKKQVCTQCVDQCSSNPVLRVQSTAGFLFHQVVNCIHLSSQVWIRPRSQTQNEDCLSEWKPSSALSSEGKISAATNMFVPTFDCVNVKASHPKFDSTSWAPGTTLWELCSTDCKVCWK